MTPSKLAQKINEVISEWAKDTSKLVVAIDGYSGIGKTTLLNSLFILNPDIIPVNRDDFMLPRKIVREKLAKADDQSKVWALEACDNKKLEDLVTAFKVALKRYIESYQPDKTADFVLKV